MNNLSVRWIDGFREPQCEPNPEFPNGIAIDISDGRKPTCSTELPYPAKRCGRFVVDCDRCGFSVDITTAGRPDDPRSIKIPCRRRHDA